MLTKEFESCVDMLPKQQVVDIQKFRENLSTMDMNLFNSLYLDVIDRGQADVRHVMTSALDVYFDRSRPVRIRVGKELIYLFPEGINGQQCKVAERHGTKWGAPEYLDRLDRDESVYGVRFAQRDQHKHQIVLTFGKYDRIIGVKIGVENNEPKKDFDESLDRLDFVVEYI